MPRKNATDESVNATEYVAPEFDESGMTTIVEASPTLVVFDTIGDTFVGYFEGSETITPQDDEPFSRFIFRDANGSRFAINKSYKLDNAMEDVEPGTLTRIRYVANIETNRKQQPMKDFQVAIKK